MVLPTCERILVLREAYASRVTFTALIDAIYIICFIHLLSAFKSEN